MIGMKQHNTATLIRRFITNTRLNTKVKYDWDFAKFLRHLKFNISCRCRWRQTSKLSVE